MQPGSPTARTGTHPAAENCQPDPLQAIASDRFNRPGRIQWTPAREWPPGLAVPAKPLFLCHVPDSTHQLRHLVAPLLCYRRHPTPAPKQKRVPVKIHLNPVHVISPADLREDPIYLLPHLRRP